MASKMTDFDGESESTSPEGNFDVEMLSEGDDKTECERAMSMILMAKREIRTSQRTMANARNVIREARKNRSGFFSRKGKGPDKRQSVMYHDKRVKGGSRQTTKGEGSRGRCFRCGKPGHIVLNCPVPPARAPPPSGKGGDSLVALSLMAVGDPDAPEEAAGAEKGEGLLEPDYEESASVIAANRPEEPETEGEAEKSDEEGEEPRDAPDLRHTLNDIITQHPDCALKSHLSSRSHKDSIRLKPESDRKGLYDPKPENRRIFDAGVSLDRLLRRGRMQSEFLPSATGRKTEKWERTLHTEARCNRQMKDVVMKNMTTLKWTQRRHAGETSAYGRVQLEDLDHRDPLFYAPTNKEERRERLQHHDKGPAPSMARRPESEYTESSTYDDSEPDEPGQGSGEVVKDKRKPEVVGSAEPMVTKKRVPQKLTRSTLRPRKPQSRQELPSQRNREWRRRP